MTISIKRYFRFDIKGSKALHEWLSALTPVVENEISHTISELSRQGEKDKEEIFVYLNYMYFYRFSLPVLEACLGRDAVLRQPQLVHFMLLTCMMGRFLDDLIDKDSGFWDDQQALYWYSHFLSRCEQYRPLQSVNLEAESKWKNALNKAMEVNPLYTNNKKTHAIVCPETCPMPLHNYPERIPYFFWLLEKGIKSNTTGLAWSIKYVSALFYHYDVDDAFNDLLRNVPSEPAYELLRNSLDNEGRVKIKTDRVLETISNCRLRAKNLIENAIKQARQNNYELGESMLSIELETLKI